MRLLVPGVCRWLPITMMNNEVVAEIKCSMPDLIRHDIDEVGIVIQFEVGSHNINMSSSDGVYLFDIFVKYIWVAGPAVGCPQEAHAP